ncbi:iron(III) transport system ATP-binding protein [Geosporobacter subterraneus DSM 17957]|uniref:ABC-type quaternary amine transporter n=1 Tax=Geosporobacter subterraneus DSM 17957 TaxID=1121919 RepID=A0A1M6BX44_9FIRM|nr:ABC transporter ATP-binding protein [Geosporobacter subterraneus]SHI53339.1 iron(III) transport system ATP-binding protein [Geosporobacter subterraneus DSM 17957]
MNELQLINISKHFDQKIVLNEINFSVRKGELVSLLGPSGCGKTTLLKIIAGLLPPDGGQLLFDGNSILNIPVERRGTVMVFQDYLLFPHLNVWNNIGFGLRMAGKGREEQAKKINEMLELVELHGFEKKYPRELSGGQKQRVALARALAIEPKVLLLDEPFSNLDARLRESMRDFVCGLQKKLKITTILVTHDKEEALLSSDRIVLLLDGKVQQIGTPEEIYLMPKNREAANFLGKKNYLKGRIEKGIFYYSGGELKSEERADGTYWMMIRPEEIKLKKDKGNASAIIVDMRFAGDRIYYKVKLGEEMLECLMLPDTIFSIGEAVNLSMDLQNIILFPE